MNDDENIAQEKNIQAVDITSQWVYIICVIILSCLIVILIITLMPLKKSYKDRNMFSDGSAVYRQVDHAKRKNELAEEFGPNFDWNFKHLRRTP